MANALVKRMGEVQDEGVLVNLMYVGTTDRYSVQYELIEVSRAAIPCLQLITNAAHSQWSHGLSVSRRVRLYVLPANSVA